MRFALSCTLAALAVTLQPEPKPAKPGVSTPNVKIPMDRLVPDAIYDVPGAPDWLAIGEQAWVSNKPKDAISRLDPKSTTVATFAVGKRPCSGLAIGFDSVWVPSCGDQTTSPSVARVDPKSGQVTATFPTGIANTEGGLAVGASSVWMLTDSRATLVRIDPATNAPVAQVRVPAGSYTVAFGEGAVWVTNTDANTLTRVDPATNLITDTIAVGGTPRFLAVGNGSVWTLNQRDGSVSRVDAKTKKVVATIEVGVPGPGGDIAVGEDSVWVTAIDIPISRIDPATNQVVQQFVGKGGDAIRIGLGAVWLSMLDQGKVWRLDPKRIEATQSF
jgi:YVTN family beta-propeller protein